MEHNAIKFSTLDYYKFKQIDTDRFVTLLEVFTIESKDKLSEGFLMYDTIYKDSNSFFGESFYDLPNGELLILLFIDSHKRLFTTVRSRFGKSGDKLEYFSKKRGEYFSIKKVQNK
jgi:hypothetical protein